MFFVARVEHVLAAPSSVPVAASVERRPVLKSGLALQLLRDYTDDEVVAEMMHQ